MKKLISVLCALALLLSTVGALADGGPVGTWVVSQFGYQGEKYPVDAFPSLVMTLVIRADQTCSVTTEDGTSEGTWVQTGNTVHLGSGVWFTFSGDTLTGQKDGVTLYLSRTAQPEQETPENPEPPENPEDPETPTDPEKPEGDQPQVPQVIGETVVKTGNDGGLALRTEPKKGKNLIAYYPNGTKVEVYSVQDGWAFVKVNGKTGYMMVQFLADFTADGEEKPENPEEKPEDKPETLPVVKEMIVKTGNDGGLALRRQAEKKNNIIAYYKNDTVVQVHAIQDGWAHVTVNGKTGYMMEKFLADVKTEEPETPADPENPEEKPEAPAVIAETVVKTGNSGGLALRKAAQKGNNIIAFYKNGTKVAIHSVADGWALVTVKGETGYMMVQYLADYKTEEPEQPEEPETPADPEKPEDPETPADPEKPEDPETPADPEKPEDKPEDKPAAPAVIGQKVVKTGNDGGLALRSSAEKKSTNILGFYANGTVVSLHGVQDGWAHVTVNGETGYMMSIYLADTAE